MMRRHSLLLCAALAILVFDKCLPTDLLECYSPIKIAYVVNDPVDGADENLAPILFLHGILASKEYWFEIPQVVADKTKRRVFSLDARNHGDSESSDCFNFDVNAQDLLYFLDEQRIPKAVLIGHSMGGISAMKLALNNPERVEMPIIEDMYVKSVSAEHCNYTSKFIQAVKEAAEHVPIDYDENAAFEFIRKYIGENEDVKVALGVNKRDFNSRSIVALTRAEDDHYKLQANVKVLIDTLRSSYTTMSENEGVYEDPAYFIFGTESPFRSDQDEVNVKKHFPQAQFIAVQDSNHNVHLNVPEKFADLVLACLHKDEEEILSAHGVRSQSVDPYLLLPFLILYSYSILRHY